ncbi:AGAP004920-PA [Anopheles gambiae str. PEST]|uniref:AGAP004920-PA n=1 Tax=Anopheles gambiae TaxID=7165 RepID=Q7Q803_ANOGA|nr:AGAP004920-PA [Anopheles gambiae str. PEST]
MNTSTLSTAFDEVDNNTRVLSLVASVPEIISSSVIHELEPVDDAHYNMSHNRRGVAAVFNHRKFLHASERKGTDADCDNIRQVLIYLQFEVRVYDDLTRKEIKQVLDDLAEEDHKNSDCLLVVIMTHGDDDVLHAKDGTFNVDRLWENFIGDSCPSLLGKPKLFFIQACRGSSFDTGVHFSQCMTQVAKTVVPYAMRELPQPSIVPGCPKSSIQYAIPSMADLLVMYSTYKGHYSWRNPSTGSWFIRALCDELREHGNSKELLQLLTSVSRRVAYEFQSNVPNNSQIDCQKQMPCIVSMLTRRIYFSKK